jgi:hypothetical protein
MDASLGDLANVANLGGVLTFAFVVWKSLDKHGDKLDKLREQHEAERTADRDALADELKVQTSMLRQMIERLARIDVRTHRADTEGESETERTPRVRKRTPPPTPFTETEPPPRGIKKP